MTKTLQECKDEISMHRVNCDYHIMKVRCTSIVVEIILDEAAELYAQQYISDNSTLIVEKFELQNENKRLLEEKAKLIEALGECQVVIHRATEFLNGSSKLSVDEVYSGLLNQSDKINPLLPAPKLTSPQ